MISQIIQQSFRRDKIGGTKALREPTVGRSEAGKGVAVRPQLLQRAARLVAAPQLPQDNVSPKPHRAPAGSPPLLL